MRSTGFVILALFGLLVSCKGPDHQPPVPDGGNQGARTSVTNRYENSRFVFSVSLPDGCALRESQNGDGIRLVIPGAQDVRLSVYGSHNIWDVRNVDELRRHFEDTDGIRIGSATSIQMGPLLGIEYVAERRGVMTKHRVLLHGDSIYGLYLEADPQAYPNALRLFDDISGTFDVGI